MFKSDFQTTKQENPAFIVWIYFEDLLRQSDSLHQILSAFKHMFRLVLRSYRVCFMELHISDFSEHSLNCEGFHRSIALKLKVLEHIRTCQNVSYMYLEHVQKSHVILWGRYFFIQKAVYKYL